MPRLEKERRVDNPPPVSGFKPIGKPRAGLEEVILTLDEYEAIRLADGLALTQQQAADKMGISRPTFSRLIEKARKKIADMLTLGLLLKIEGGTVCFRKTLAQCSQCGKVFSPEHRNCPYCGSEKILVVSRKHPKCR